ncbi:MAG: ABC transporter ATP-binding protein [Rhodospirillaceae bacterium]|nr:ABC transporter ATP-binding protein [Rhodospirillaceae bacterium]
MSAVVSIQNLTLAFAGFDDTVTALRGVSLDVNAGEIVGLVGESGSGKSVTAMSVLRLLPEAKTRYGGRIMALGHDVLKAGTREMQALRGADVAMIFQEPMTALNPVLKVRDHITDVILRHRDMSGDAATALALDLLRDMKIADAERVLNAYPHELSGGMRQRVMIAMAFSCHPKLIIADEPTTALDVTVQAQILNLLKERAAATDTAVLLITHDLAVVAQLCDRVYVMYRGEVVEHGATSSIITKPQHTYTRALLNALPEGKAPKTRLETVAAAMLGESAEKRAAPLAAKPRTGKVLLEAADVTVRYPRAHDVLGRVTSMHTAVDQVSLQINEGETLSLVGESGCGKTSFAATLVGLTPLTSGRLIYRGVDLSGTPPETRREIQIVFQDPQSSLDPRWPAWRIMTEPLTVAGKPSRAALREQAAALCRMVGLDPSSMDRLPHEFSGGQRQRLAIARALSVQPRLLVLDEPTSALDVSVQAQILNLLLDLQDQNGLSYLFISHNVSVVRHISDHVAVMHRGRIVESGAASDVLNAPQENYTRTLMDAVPKLAV